MTIRFLRLPDICTKYGRSRTSVYRDIGRGVLPPLISLGPRCSAIVESELEAVLKARSAGATEDEIRRLVADLVADRRKGAQPLHAATGGGA